MTRPMVISPQKSLAWPRLSRVFLIVRTSVTVETSKGTKLPIATRKNRFGNTTGARAKANTSAIPQASDEIGRRGIPMHHMSFSSLCLGHDEVTGGYSGNHRQRALRGATGLPGRETDLPASHSGC